MTDTTKTYYWFLIVGEKGRAVTCSMHPLGRYLHEATKRGSHFLQDVGTPDASRCLVLGSGEYAHRKDALEQMENYASAHDAINTHSKGKQNPKTCDYSQGLIYRIVTPDGFVYVGSTTTTLKERYHAHRGMCAQKPDMKVYKKVRECGGWAHVTCEALEPFPCTTRKELETRERYWITQVDPEKSLNSVLPGKEPKVHKSVKTVQAAATVTDIAALTTTDVTPSGHPSLKVSLQKLSDYSKGQIYALVNDIDDKVYIGSTIVSLKTRFAVHKYDYTKRPGKHHLHFREIGGMEHVTMELLENYPCTSAYELHQREQHWMDQYPKDRLLNSIPASHRKLKPDVPVEVVQQVNETVETAKKMANKPYKQSWYQKNKELVKARAKAYYETNTEKVKANVKAYAEANHEKVLNYQRAYNKREDVKERIKEYNEEHREKKQEYMKVYNREYREKKRRDAAAAATASTSSS